MFIHRGLHRGAIVLSGGPGAGKTSLLQALARFGYLTVTESGRAVIRQQRALAGDALPWRNRQAFAAAMLDRDRRQYRRYSRRGGPVFFDRGVVDVLGYARLERLRESAALRWAARRYRYAPEVLMLPPWPDIYRHDQERKQTLAEAERTFQVLWDTYLDQGYRPLLVPRGTIRERRDWVLSHLGLACSPIHDAPGKC
ncbi:predicted ATPase [Alloalcanivorax xenomutans]|uniref:AAA family ATPase n=1 Tax=Alloalcanivorax xenomutans TaxID=1094342 RepID=UPI000BC68A5C|nr:AAA family ATPase [Alloalcanivorax xenomutans]SOC04224.1 predicted ATPase [Alloalcanivorax xenomutans]